MSTLGTMVSRISTEVRGTISSAEIKVKIFEAIDAYSHENFGWNEATDSFSTVVSQQEYEMDGADAPGDIVLIETMSVEYGSRKTRLFPADPSNLRTDRLVVTNSIPTHWAVWNNKINIFPAPNSVYTMWLDYIQDVNTLTAASADASTNQWFVQGERLIRAHAKALIFGELLRNDTEQGRSIELASRAYLDLKRKAGNLRAGFSPIPWEI
jgi:hypothetical protein